MTVRLPVGYRTCAGIGVLLGALLLLSHGCTGEQDAEKTRSPAGREAGGGRTRSEAVVHVNSEEEFRKHVLQAELPCLADFFSESCPPCRMLGPTIEALAEKYKGKATICKVSLDRIETRGLPEQYRITGIPAVLFFEKGKETQRLIGLRPEEEYTRVLETMIEAADQ